VTLKYSINPISKDYFFLTDTERALIQMSVMEWHIENYVQKLWTPGVTLTEVANHVILVESMNDVELIENLADMEELTGGGHWQDSAPQEGSRILAVRPTIYDLFKRGRTKNTEEFFKEQNWDYEGQFVKKTMF